MLKLIEIDHGNSQKQVDSIKISSTKLTKSPFLVKGVIKLKS